MADITAAQVKELRDATNVSMMACKEALVEAEGDIEKATRLLREKGMAVAAKKASRTTDQGLIASARDDSGNIASLIEVNCETDFVARNESFQEFVRILAEKACTTDQALGEELRDEVTAKVAEIGENIVIPRHTRYVLQGNGALASYIHLGGKVGVLLELGCEKEETAEHDGFKEVIKDLTLHVAACSPQYLTAEEVPEAVLNAEREIYAKQVKDKPPQIVDKIVEGKLRKFCAEVCLVDQGFVKEPKQSVSSLLQAKDKEVGDTLALRRFVRYQLGE